MKVSFEGFDEKVLSFVSDSTTKPAKGKTVKMAGNGKVSGCSAGDDFIGAAIAADDNFAAVQVGGYIKLPYTGTAPTVGYGILVADSAGGVKGAESGKSYLIIDVDTTAKTVGFIL